MKLERLELSGFKSFVDPVSAQFSANLTAIVGPNGCGKSNISDAVTWVLGERSAKSLRADTMGDVIFNGSRTRKPIGMAEVTLVLSADASFPHVEDGRISIGRQVFSSGESKYLINGKTARLKDVKDLLMGTGLGIRAYSQIEQGKIEMILAGKPQERRRLLEEAAGITRYKLRKQQAEVKLEEARGNLDRLNDVISEVEKRLRSLKRQASAAQRFADRRREHQELLRQVMLARAIALFERRDELASRIAEAERHAAEAVGELSRGEADLAADREALDAMAADVAKRHQIAASVAARIEGRQEFLKGARETLKEISERRAAGATLASRSEAEIEQLVESLGTLETNAEEIAGEHANATSAFDESTALLDSSERVAHLAAQKVEDLRAQLMASLGKVTAARNSVHQSQVDSEKGQYREGHLRDELEKRTEALRKADSAAAEADQSLRELETRVAGSERTRDQAKKTLEAATRRLQELDKRRTELEGRLAKDTQRRQFLGELSEARDQRRSTLTERLAAAGIANAEFLSDRIQALEGWERSIDLFLGHLAEAILIPEGVDPLDVAASLAGGSGTARLLQPSALSTPELDRPAAEDPAIRATLAEALGIGADLARLLPVAYLVDEPADAARLARRHPGISFISRQRMWAGSGWIHVRGSEADPGAFERDHELARLAEVLPRLTRQKDEIGAEREGVAREIGGMKASLERAETALREGTEALAVARARAEDLTATRNRLDAERRTLELEAQEIARELERVGSRREDLLADLRKAEEKHKELEEQFDAAQGEAQAARDEREKVRTASASKQGALDLIRHRVEAHQTELARIRGEITRHQEQLENWKLEAEQLGTRREDLTAKMGEAERELQEALEKKASLAGSLREADERVESARMALLEKEKGVRATRASLETQRAEIGELRVEEAGLKQEIQHLSNDHKEAFHASLPEAPEPPERPLDELEADLERTAGVLERIGPVNELAAEEYTEHEERHTYLTEQREDVRESVRRLMATIAEINETSSKRFMETFVAVNTHLGEMFRELFGGGDAEMQLLDEEDILDSGIEILARPPGKRLQNLMLLSGGEKALTALALLFALFRTKPSPFCFLDEVDAPLDDVNTLRFVKALKKMSRTTQFIVITHNKLTMEAASTLYGVTMQEQGVSKLVSVELDDIIPAEGQDEQAATA